MLKLSFIAPSGYGKSTAIQILSNYYDIRNIKIAEPLYDLQEIFYQYINKEIGNKQDGELLQFLGSKIRKEQPYFLTEHFANRMASADSCEIVTNDDCRPPDYSYLKGLGFKFVIINGFKRDRDDHTPINSKSLLEWNNESADYDYVLDNLGTIEEYQTNIICLMKEIELNERTKTIRKN